MKINRYTSVLSNGVRLLVVPIPGSTTIDFRYFTHSGSVFAQHDQFELPHLLEHLILLGNKNLPDPAKFAANMERYTSSWGGLTNRYLNTFWYMKSPRHLGEFLYSVADQILEPTLQDNAVEEQKEVIRQELNKDSVNERVLRFYAGHQARLPQLFPSHKSRAESLQNISPEDVRRYFSNYFVSDNTAIAVTGNIDQKQIALLESKLEVALQPYRRGVKNTIKLGKPLMDTPRIIEFESHNRNLVYFCLSFDVEGRQISDLPSLKVLQALWGGGKGARMYQKVRRAGLTYSPQTLALLEYERTRLALWDDVEPEKFMDFLKLALTELRDLASGNFSDEELERAKLFREEREITAYPTPSSWAGTFGDEWALGLERPSPEEIVAATENVSREDIVKVAGRYLNIWQLTISNNHQSLQDIEALINDSLGQTQG